MQPIVEYVEQLRSRADDRGKEGSPAAAVYARVASELEELLEQFEDEELSLAQAAEESGYAPDALRRLRKAGKWSGTRRDLPRRPRPVPPQPRLQLESAAPSGTASDRPSLVDDVLDRQASAPTATARRTRRRS